MATRYRRDKQKLQIEGQTIQWPRDTDEINRRYKSKVRQYNGHKIPTRLFCLTFDLYLLFISSVSCGHCIVWPSICNFCISRRYRLAIVLSDLRFVASVYLVGISWPLYCLTFDLYLLFISSVSCGHCIVWPSICNFCISRRYLLAIVLFDLRFVAYNGHKIPTK
jgi:hypothetical protein